MNLFRHEQSDIVLTDDQMRALGKVMTQTLTAYGQGERAESTMPVEIYTLDNDQIAVMSSDISEHISPILRRTVYTYWVHFYTVNQRTGNCRENLVFAFLPRLLYNKQAVTFHFDRLADRDLVPVEDLIDPTAEDADGGTSNAPPAA